jgi:hypothetical protein
VTSLNEEVTPRVTIKPGHELQGVGFINGRGIGISTKEEATPNEMVVTMIKVEVEEQTKVVKRQVEELTTQVNKQTVAFSQMAGAAASSHKDFENHLERQR